MNDAIKLIQEKRNQALKTFQYYDELLTVAINNNPDKDEINIIDKTGRINYVESLAVSLLKREDRPLTTTELHHHYLQNKPVHLTSISRQDYNSRLTEIIRDKGVFTHKKLAKGQRNHFYFLSTWGDSYTEKAQIIK